MDFLTGVLLPDVLVEESAEAARLMHRLKLLLRHAGVGVVLPGVRVNVERVGLLMLDVVDPARFGHVSCTR